MPRDPSGLRLEGGGPVAPLGYRDSPRLHLCLSSSTHAITHGPIATISDRDFPTVP
jgi:hypothetical protein